MPGFHTLKQEGYPLTATEVAVINSIAALGDPGADRIMFWDESANAFAWLTAGTGLTITGTTMTASAAVPTVITVANEATDETCFPLFVTAATGDLGPKSNAGLTFNSSTAELGATLFAGAFNGTLGATTANTIVGTTITANTGLVPDANDGAYLGQAGTAFSDLFLAEGGVINWDSGDVTLTQTGNELALSGGTFKVDNDTWFTAKDYAGTSYVNMFKVNASDEIDFGATLNIPGYIEGPTDGGAITLFDMPVVSAADNVEQSATFKVDGNNFLKLYSLADGAGSIDTQSIRAYYPIVPNTSDLAALGSATLMWSDLFLASGGVIDFNGGASTITHSANTLTIGGSSATTLALGSNSLTMTGSLAATGARVTKGWFTDVEITNLPTINGGTLATALTTLAPLANPTFTGTVILPKTIEIQDTSADHQYVLAVSELTADRTITLPLLTGADEFVFKDHTQTLTNKRITKRVVTTTDDATAEINVDTTDVYELSAVANATTFTTTGTPTDGQTLMIRIKDAGGAKGLTWDAIFVAIGVTAPTTTVAGKWHYVGCQYNSAATKWHIIAVGVQA